MSRHPSRQRLQRWLDTGESRRVDRHVSDCEHCHEALEALTELDVEVVADLQTAIAPPADLNDRTNLGVDDRLRSEAAAGTFADLFLIPWDLVHSILDPATDSDTAHQDDVDADGSPR